MDSEFSIEVLPIHRQKGFDRSTLAGAYAASAPRRAARVRKKDHLILFVSFHGQLVSDERQRAMLEKLAQGYYATEGTVTAALTLLAENLNQFLLKQNGRVADPAQQLVAMVTMLVVREGRLVIAQCGPSHVIALDGRKADDYQSGAAGGRGLGVARNAQIRFHQLGLQPGLLLVVTAQVPAAWNQAVFQGLERQPLLELSLIHI